MRYTRFFLPAALCGLLCAAGLAQPPALPGLLRLALAQHLGLRMAHQDSLRASREAAIARTALMPTVAASAGATATATNAQLQFFSGETVARTGALSNNLNVSIAGRWAVYDPAARARADRLHAAAMQQHWQIRMAADACIEAVAQAWVRLGMAGAEAQAARLRVELAQARLALAETRLRLGAGAQLALIQAQTDVAAGQQAQTAAEFDQQAAAHSLYYALGPDNASATDSSAAPPPGWAPPDIADRDTLSLPPGLRTQPQAHAAQDRHAADLQAAAGEVALADMAQREAALARLPRLELSATLNASRSAAQVGVLKSNQSYGPTLGLGFSYPLWDARANRLRMATAAIDAQSARLRVAETRRTLAQALDAAWLALRQAEAQQPLAQARARLASEAYDLALARYRLGQLTDLDIRTAEDAVVQATLALTRLAWERSSHRIRICALAGQLGDLL